MKQTLNRRFPVLLLCVIVLLTLCGCQKTIHFYGFSPNYYLYQLPLDEDSIAYIESRLLGMTPDDIIEEWYLWDRKCEEAFPPGFMYINKPITVERREFTEATQSEEGYRLISLIFTSNNREEAKMAGIVYRCECGNAEETAEVAEAIYLAMAEQHGKAEHGHIINTKVLCSEGVFDEIRESRDNVWAEVWCVGEFSYLQMNVRVREDEGLFVVELEYRILPEEGDRIEPGYEAPYSLGRYIKGEHLLGADD